MLIFCVLEISCVAKEVLNAVSPLMGVFGEEVLVQCQKNYITENGLDTFVATCQADRTWDNVLSCNGKIEIPNTLACKIKPNNQEDQQFIT